jgi:class 3 adenylate cyclase
VNCPGCGNEVGEDFRFCPSCGTALGDTVTPGREERKVVSVVFADLAGFTGRAEQLDPEDVRALLSSYHAHLRGELERFGGTVEKFIGDAVMAVFGAPAAHEDDPERAVRAALAIRDWASEEAADLQVRIAVNTGEALVALDARAARGEALVAGDVVNTAARLQTAAPLNGVLVGEQTYRATVDAIDYRPAEPVEAKGKSGPIHVWEAVGARARIGDRPASATPLVGRERELALLTQTLARVREERSPQLVTLVGVPGIGKSRLVAELANVVEQDDELVSWRVGRSLSYGDGVTFWALAEIVKAQAGILDSDSAEQAHEKLRGTVEQLATDGAETQWLERHLRPLTGLAEESSGSADEVFAAWRRFLEALADERPLVLVFEDLHWADDALLDFIDELVDRVAPVPLLVLATARPELLQRRGGWGGGKPNAATISLAPLTETETAQLLEGLIETPAVDPGTHEELLARAGGNPLYAEQYARVLLERGDFSELPETVQGIIAARLDALSEGEKLLLQDAAVMGQVFWLGAVEAVGGLARRQAEELLRGLERKEFVRRGRNSSVASESEYAFRHLLIRDVAYGQIPRAVRSSKHRAAATWIDSIGRPEEQAELLAHHYVQALELAEAAGLDSADLAKPARTALRDAGDRAAALYALDAAERFYDAALRLWTDHDSERAQLLLRRAAPIRAVGGGDPERLLEARDALVAAGNRGLAAEAEMQLSQTFWIRGEPELSQAHADSAEALLEGAEPSRSTAWAMLRRASAAAIVHGDPQRSLELTARVLELSERLGWTDGVSEALNLRGLDRTDLGDRGGIEDLERSIEMAAATGALGPLSRAYNNLSTQYGIFGDLTRGYELRLEGARVAERIGAAPEKQWFLGVLTEFPYRFGDWDESLRMIAEFLAPVDAGEPHYVSWQVLARRADILMARGDVAASLADADRALELVAATPDPQARYFVNALCAHVFAGVSLDDRAAELIRAIRDDLLRDVGLSFAAIALPGLASAALRLGLLPELASSLEQHVSNPWIEVVRLYAAGDFVAGADLLGEIGSKPEEAEARLHAAEQLAAAGRAGEANAQRAQATAFFRSVGATRYLESAEAVQESGKRLL